MPRNSNEYQREYNSKHNTPNTCEICYGSYRKYFYKTHLRSLKHQNALLEQIEQEKRNNTAIQMFKVMKDRIKQLEGQIANTV